MKGMLGQGQPETGEFNFMDYLLGLQGTQAPVTPESLLAPGTASPEKMLKDPTKDPLQAMFAAMPMPSMNPAIQPAPTKAVANQPTADALTTQSDTAKPAWSTLQLQTQTVQDTALSSAVPAAEGMQQVQGPQKEETGISLEGFQKVSGQQEVDVSISRQGQALAAKKYAGNVSSRDSVAETPKQGAPDARLQPEKAVETQTNTAAPAVVLSEAKPETAPLKKKDGQSLSSLDFAPAPSAHKAESAVHTADSKSVDASTGNVAIPEVFQRVETLVQKGGGEMTVALDPPDLGKIEVKVKTSGNRVEIEMRSESVQAKNALESHFGELKSAMQSHDLHLAKLDVSVHRDSSSFGQSFAGMHDGRNAGNTQNNQGQGRSFSDSNRRGTVIQSAPQMAMRPVASVTGNGRVDLRI